MIKFPFPTSSLKCAMSVAAFPGGMLGARTRLRHHLLSLVEWCASCNNKVNDIIEKIKTKDLRETNLLILAGANVVAELDRNRNIFGKGG